MPMRADTLIGDMGSSLSGGQKQRILIARALYRRPQILILDEATSHLDLENEATISETFAKIKATRIVVAHRRETIERADKIFILEPNGIRELRRRPKLDIVNGDGGVNTVDL